MVFGIWFCAELADGAILSFRGRAVIAPDVEDEGILAQPHFFERIDESADLRIGVFAETRIDFHQPRLESTLGLGNVGPRRHRRMARCQLGVRRNPAQGLLSREDLLTQLVPALIELAPVFLRPLLRDMVRAVNGPRPQYMKKGLSGA